MKLPNSTGRSGDDLMQKLALTEQERAQLDRQNQQLTEWAGRQTTIEGLVNQWISFVADVEEGYVASADDYAFDLHDIRDVLDKALAAAPVGLAEKLSDIVRAADERYRNATSFDDGIALAQYARLGDGWWWRRAPKQGPILRYFQPRDSQ